ncbi:MAG: glycosyltransferase family 39 protein, partial [Chloroflexi bacterium]|nr:glycosyltransferase family 39 protein [Chloroflexota bacterium]
MGRAVLSDPRNLRRLIPNASLLVTVTIGLGFALRVYALDYRPLWVDEGYTAFVQAQNLSYILTEIVADHVPFYYVLLHYWTRLAGTGEFALRYTAVFFGSASLPLVYVIARDLFDRRVALASLLLASLSPFLVYWAQQARPTSAALFFSLLIVWSYHRVVRISAEEQVVGETRPRLALRYWMVIVLANLLGLYSFYYVAFVILAANIYFVVSLLRHQAVRLLRAWGIAQGLTFALFLPWLLRQAGKIIAYISPNPSVVVQLDWAKPFAPRGDYTAVSMGPGQILWQMWRSLTTGEVIVGGEDLADQRLGLLTVSSLLFFLGILVLIRHSKPTLPARRLFLVSWLLVPILLTILLDQHGANFFPRQLLGIAPAFYRLGWTRHG